MKKTIIKLDELSYTAYPIEIYRDKTILAKGTCFVYSDAGALYLVTNWHNVTGLNPVTGSSLSPTGARPNLLSVLMPAPSRLDKWNSIPVPLYEKDEPLWFEHPYHREKVDVVAIPLTKHPSDWIEPRPINQVKDLVDDMLIMAGMDVYVLGFPFGITGGGAWPIWKQASLATEPQINHDNLPKMLVDTATRPGMSGSPVVCKKWGWYLNANGNTCPRDGTSSQFLGIYSGRIGAEDELKAQLGIVWKRSAIEEIIKGKTLGQKR